VANPPAVIVATVVVCEVHVAVLVKFCVELSEKVPVAVNCSVVPFTIEGLAGVTAIDTSVGVVALTVRVVEPLTPPEAACILLVPAATPVANPPTVIFATPVVCELQVTELVKFCVELSEKVPVAVNCSVALFAIDGFAGVTAIDTNVGAVTVSCVVPSTAPEAA
jgi:1,4-dihydroxy-2-naphthoyl-CoA synthase